MRALKSAAARIPQKTAENIIIRACAAPMNLGRLAGFGCCRFQYAREEASEYHGSDDCNSFHVFGIPANAISDFQCLLALSVELHTDDPQTFEWFAA
jgi:hypothetical protein